MFTGIVEAQGELRGRRQTGGGTRLNFSHPWGAGAVAAGDSVAVNGCCLTAVDPGPEGFGADVSPETLRLTTMGGWSPGQRVNLERSLTPSSRLGGHFVTGHVDGLGELVSDRQEGGCWTMTFRAPRPLARFLATKGSVAVDGVSLTVAGVEAECFRVAVIPTTRSVTTLGALPVGAAVHLEMDILAKYVEALLRGAPEGVSMDLLRRHGFAT